MVSFLKGRGSGQNVGLSQLVLQPPYRLEICSRLSSGETQNRTGRYFPCSHLTAGDIAKSHCGVATSCCLNAYVSK